MPLHVQGLRCEARLPHPIRWWRYSAEARLALLGTGELGLWLQARASFSCAD